MTSEDIPCWRCGKLSKRGKGKRLGDGRYQCSVCTKSLRSRRKFVTEIMTLGDFGGKTE